MKRDGVNKINLANTVDYGDPAKVRRIFQNVKSTVGELPLAAHFHDTPGLGLANEMAALDVGIRRFDPVLLNLAGILLLRRRIRQCCHRGHSAFI